MGKSSGATFSKIQVDTASKCCQMAANDRILADERPFHHFLAILAHFMPIYSRIFENSTARLRCPSGVSRALFRRSETISKVGNIKIMSASSPFFFSPLSPPFSFLSRVVSRLMGVQKTQFRCRSGQNGQIFRSHLFKNPGRYIYIYITDDEQINCRVDLAFYSYLVSYYTTCVQHSSALIYIYIYIYIYIRLNCEIDVNASGSDRNEKKLPEVYY